MRFVFWGPSSNNAGEAIKQAMQHVRDTSNFNWTFIFILAVVFYVYWNEFQKKNYKALIAGLSLYSVHWFYEICNAIIAAITGYPLWTVSADSTTFILLIGVSWELSMMFTMAGIISWKMLPDDRNKRYFAKGNFKGIPCKAFTTFSMALLFALIESFLAGTSNGSFLWYYPWWGVLPVFITTYIPFFIAANYIPDLKPKTQKIILGCLVGINILLLAILVPLGII